MRACDLQTVWHPHTPPPMTNATASVQSTMLALFVLLAPAFAAERLDSALTDASPATVQTVAVPAGSADEAEMLSFTMPEIVVVPREPAMLPEITVVGRRLEPAMMPEVVVVGRRLEAETRPDTLLLSAAPVALLPEVAALGAAEALRP